MSCGCRQCSQGVKRLAGVAPHRSRFAGIMVPMAGEGEAIGRWGPVTTYGGRTEGEPCPTGIGDMCGDYDVSAWHYAAKVWYQKALWLREMVTQAYRNRDDGPPAIVQAADTALPQVAAKLGADLGYLDGAKVASLVQIQRQFKLICEAYAVAVDATGFEIDGNIYEPSTDPEAIPPVIPWPDFDILGGLTRGLLPMAIGAAVLLVLIARAKSAAPARRAA